MAQSPINLPIWSHCPWRSLHFNSISFFAAPEFSNISHQTTRIGTPIHTHVIWHTHTPITTRICIYTHIYTYTPHGTKKWNKKMFLGGVTLSKNPLFVARMKNFFFDSLYHFEMALNSFLLLNLFQRSLGQPVWPNFWIKSLPNFVQIFPKIKRSGFDLNTDNFSKQPKK